MTRRIAGGRRAALVVAHRAFNRHAPSAVLVRSRRASGSRGCRDRADQIMGDVLAAHGFITDHNETLTVVDAWLAAKNRPPVSSLRGAYRLCCRLDTVHRRFARESICVRDAVPVLKHRFEHRERGDAPRARPGALELRETSEGVIEIIDRLTMACDGVSTIILSRYLEGGIHG